MSWLFFFYSQEPFLSTNSGVHSHKMKENEEASSSKLTMDRAFTMERSWLPLSQNSLAFLFLHGHGDMETCVRS